MKINSENLWKYINELATNKKVKFNVYYDDSYVTQIYWNGDNFEWETGTFTSEAFFNPLYDFIPIEEDKKIEKLDIKRDEVTPNSYYILNEYGTRCYLTKHSKVIADKINELINEINKLKEAK